MGATVVIQETGDYAITDEQGIARLTTTTPAVTIKILGVGYETAVQPMPAGSDRMTAYLYPMSADDEGLEVIADRIVENISRISFTAEELRRTPGSRGDPLKVVQSLPGVVARGDKFYVRGSSTRDNGVWVNRIPLHYLFHQGDVFGNGSTINPDLVKDSNIFLAGFPVEYNDRTGGYVDVELRAPKTDRVHQNYRVATNEAAFLLEGPIDDDDSFYVGARRSYLDMVLTPERVNHWIGADRNSKRSSVVTLPQYFDAQASWRHELDSGSIDVQYFAAADKLASNWRDRAKIDPDLLGRLSAEKNYQTAGMTWRQHWASGWDSITALAVNKFFQRQVAGTDTVGQSYFARTDMLQGYFHPELHWRRNDEEQYSFGAEAAYGRYPIDVYFGAEPSDDGIQYNLTSLAKYHVTGNFRAGSIAAYIKQHRRWGERWHTALGVRGSVVRGSGNIDMTNLSPRATIEYQFTPTTRLFSSWGHYVQTPPESNMVPGFGNPRLSYAEAEHRVMGVQHAINTLWTMQLEAYHKPMTKIATYVNAEAPPNNYQDIGQGEAYGFDVLLKRALRGRRMGWFSYSFSRATRSDRINGDNYNFTGNIPHTFTLVWSQRLAGAWRHWDIGVRLHAQSGQPYTPVVGRQKWCRDTRTPCTDPTISDKDPNVYWQPVYADINSARLPASYRLDLRFDRPVRFDTWTMNIYADLQNVTFAENVTGYNYGSTYANYARPTKATEFSFILPFVGVEARF